MGIMGVLGENNILWEKLFGGKDNKGSREREREKGREREGEKKKSLKKIHF